MTLALAATSLIAAMVAASVPAQAATRRFRIGITDFRHYYEQTTCPVQAAAFEVRTTVRQISQERFKKGDCVQVRFIADPGGKTDLATGQAPKVEGATFEVRFSGEDGKLITTSTASPIAGFTDYYGAFVNIGTDWPSGDITVVARPTSAGDTGSGKFRMSVNALGTRILLEQPAYKPGDMITVRGVTWKDHHRVTALTAQMSYPEDPQFKDNVPATGSVSLRRADGSTVKKEFTSALDGTFSVTFDPSDYGNVAAGAADNFVRALKLTATASYDDPVTSTWRTSKGDPDAEAYVKFQSVPDRAQVLSHFTSETGWVAPGAEYLHKIEYRNVSPAGASGVVITDVLPDGSVFLGAAPAPSSVSGRTLTWRIGAVKAGSDWAGNRRVIVRARALTEVQDRTIVWKDLSSTATITQNGKGASSSTTRGPKVTTLDTARYGTRPFPVVLVDYQDAYHSPTRPGWYFDQIINEGLKNSSLVTLYGEMSFGQLFPHGTVPSLEAKDATFDAAPTYKWATPKPRGVCLGAPLIVPNPQSDVSEYKPAGTRINGGWYRLPGTQSYYGGDEASYGETALALGGLPRLGIDGACGPTGKIAFDAASIADPDLDYNDYDPDRNGVVDFFMVVSRGLGGNGDSQIRGGYDAVWPHSSSLESYFIDQNGEKGYVSHDQRRDLSERPLWYIDASRTKTTTKDMGDALKAYVRVGPYNANPEVSSTSVIAHEYGHSLGLPDYYSSGSRRSVGYWELMSTDYSQFMSVFSRQDLGWVVPKVLAGGNVNARITESKTDTHEIVWRDSAGRSYTLAGSDVHNADAYYVPLPRRTLLDKAPQGKRVWYSSSGNDFGCPGKTLDVRLPLMGKAEGGDTVSLTFKSSYEIEWDYDYGFVMVSTDDGETFTSLESANGTTTPQAWNPNAIGCQTQYGNGISGTSSQTTFPVNAATRSPADGSYGTNPFIDDKFDLSAYAGRPIVLRFAYSTDAGLAKKGWFIDDIKLVNETKSQTYFADDAESQRVEWAPGGWTRVAAGPGTADHGYYLELRDRLSFDYDGRGQGDRVPIDWIPGVSLWFTDELAGYGNTGQQTNDYPNQTPIDSRPQQGSTAPRLQDAAFWPLPGVNRFTDSSWVDNYGGAGNKKELKFGCFSMQVNDIDGLGTPGATADLVLAANSAKCFRAAAVLGTKTTKPVARPESGGGTLPATGVGADWVGPLLAALSLVLAARVRRTARDVP